MTQTTDDGTIEFRFFRPFARVVRLAGDFSRWADQALEMLPDGHGWWLIGLNLEPGEYRFRYIADDQWYTDFAANGIEVTGEAWNSVLVVPERKEQFDLTEKHRTKHEKTMAKSAA